MAQAYMDKLTNKTAGRMPAALKKKTRKERFQEAAKRRLGGAKRSETNLMDKKRRLETNSMAEKKDVFVNKIKNVSDNDGKAALFERIKKHKVETPSRRR